MGGGGGIPGGTDCSLSSLKLEINCLLPDSAKPLQPSLSCFVKVHGAACRENEPEVVPGNRINQSMLV